MLTTIPQELHVVQALAPATDAAGRNGVAVSLKNYRRAWIVLNIDQAAAATIAITVEQCTAVAGTGNKAITANVPIWAAQDQAAASGDIPVRQTDGVAFTTDAGLKKKVVIFQIDPVSLDVANGFDCVRVVTGASSVANLTSAVYLIEPRYPQASLLSARID